MILSNETMIFDWTYNEFSESKMEYVLQFNTQI